MKKTLVLYFDIQNEVTFAYQYIKKSIRMRQEELLSCFPQNQVDIFMARGKDSYISKNTFAPQFQKIGKKWKKGEIGAITADLVLGFPIPVGVTALFPSIRDITLDKTRIEALFPQYTLRSLLCQNYSEIEKKFGNIQSPLKVLKPLCGTRGRGIFIQEQLPQEDALPKGYYPYLLQEFFDTSAGFYEYPGYHDFRVVILNGVVVGKFLRQPKRGSYISNTHKKGIFLDLSGYILPKEIEQIIQEIELFLSKNHSIRYYSIDFGRGKNGEIKIFELNSAPLTFYSTCRAYPWKVYRKKYFENIIKDSTIELYFLEISLCQNTHHHHQKSESPKPSFEKSKPTTRKLKIWLLTLVKKKKKKRKKNFQK